MPLVLLFFLGDNVDFETASACVVETKSGAGRLKSTHAMDKRAILPLFFKAIPVVTLRDTVRGAV